jgi:hypothetical protein
MKQPLPAPAVRVRPPFPRAFYLSLLATTLFSMGLTMTIPIMSLFVTDEIGAAEHWVGTHPRRSIF